MSTEWLTIGDKLYGGMATLEICTGSAGIKLEVKCRDRFVKIWLSAEAAEEAADCLSFLARREKENSRAPL
jgi:hypothetical protein